MPQFITKADNTGSTAGASATVIQTATAVAAGTAQTLASPSAPRAFVLSGTFVATIKIQVSMNGTTWYDLASYTAPAVLESTGPWKYVRGNCTAFTSGTATLTMITA